MLNGCDVGQANNLINDYTLLLLFQRSVLTYIQEGVNQQAVSSIKTLSVKCVWWEEHFLFTALFSRGLHFLFPFAMPAKHFFFSFRFFPNADFRPRRS